MPCWAQLVPFDISSSNSRSRSASVLLVFGAQDFLRAGSKLSQNLRIAILNIESASDI